MLAYKTTMKRIRLIFEQEKDGVTKRFGYQLNQKEQEYITCDFDESYEPQNISESKSIGNTTVFGKKMWRLIRFALNEKD